MFALVSVYCASDRETATETEIGFMALIDCFPPEQRKQMKCALRAVLRCLGGEMFNWKRVMLSILRASQFLGYPENIVLESVRYLESISQISALYIKKYWPK